MRFKNPTVVNDMVRLESENQRLYALLCAADGYVRDQSGHKDICITSVHRATNKHSVHAHWRGADIRIGLPVRGDEATEIDVGEARALCDWLEECFCYDESHVVYRFELFVDKQGAYEAKSHIHVQVKGYEPWS